LFAGPISDWDTNKVTLCHWSDYYDSIWDHPECPPDSVVEDDRACDDWVRAQSRKLKARRLSGRSSRYTKSAYDHDDVVVIGDGD
jgi:hypothetical protein